MPPQHEPKHPRIDLPGAGTRLFRGPRGIVPYVALWSDEEFLHSPVVVTERGIRYADELSTDRDALGLLWTRVRSRPGSGEPVYQRMHALRQRRAMRRLQCQICAGPADSTEHGHLWLVPDQRAEYPDWPERARCTHPPLCQRCARIAVKACPWLASGHLAVRAWSRVSGAFGALHRPGGRSALDADTVTLTYNDPRLPWLQADQLTRELLTCRQVRL